jgi:hypothetical protein
VVVNLDEKTVFFLGYVVPVESVDERWENAVAFCGSFLSSGALSARKVDCQLLK